MALYTYVALSESGVALTEEAVAASEQELRAELASRGLLVVRVRLKRGVVGWRPRKVKPEDFALFNQELTALVRAGLTVPDALRLAADRPDSPALGAVLERVLHDVREGKSLSEACAQHPEVFGRLYLAALRTSEKTGDLAAVLVRQQGYMRHRLALRKKVSQALTYPLFLLFALVTILAVLFVFVLPRFVAMYADLGAELPLPTRVLLGIVENLHFVAPALLAATVLSVFGWRKWRESAAGRQRLDRWRESLPYVGELARTLSAAHLSRALSTLLAGGTPLVEALRTAADSVASQVHLDRLQEATRLVTEGSSLGQAARRTDLVPPMAVRMIEVGEATGGLDVMLGEVAQFYEELFDTKLTRIMGLVEPLLMLLMGVLIGGIIIVMYLPIFHMADIIK